MSSPEDNTSGSKDKEDAMLVSTLDGKLSHRLHCRDPSLDTNLGQKVPKFSLNMNNYFSIHLRLLNNLNEDRRHDIFMLNPECHIKFLEKNLNFLSRKPPRCNDFKISSSKSSTYSIETSQKVSSLPKTGLPSLTFTSLSEGSVSQLKTIERRLDNGSCMDTVLYDGSKIKMSNIPSQKRPVDKPSLATPPIVKIKEKYSSKNERYRVYQPNFSLKPINTDKAAEYQKSKTDSDNQFEFTVAGEKIVSFVCSPPASRRTKEGEINFICDSDEESTVSSSKCSSETASNTSSRLSYSKYTKRKETLPAREQVIKTNILMWRPPSTSRSAVAPPEGKAILSRSSYSRQNKQKPAENCINFFGSINSICSVASTNNRGFKSSYDQETVMFRETALRGCYDIETLLKEIKSTSPEVEKEVSQTREAIFSAVRLQRSNDNIVSDSVQSIVDICNSWIKLNAHFERKDFKDFLEINGVDLTIFGDFAQWQCMSRVFVDKLINVLKKVSSDKSSKIPSQGLFPTKGPGLAPVPSNVEVKGDSNPSNNHLVVPNLSTSITAIEAQGKRWKQRRFLSEKTDSEKVVVTSNKPCRSIFEMDSSIQNPLLGSNCNTERIFGQGDNGLNFARDIPKGNRSFPTKNCQHAQGDVNLIFNGSNHCSNSGFFDKNICVPNCCAARGEPNMCPLTSENELCTPVTNLVDMPLNNLFPVNIQQAVPTVPPIYNNQHCLVSNNQFQPSFNHSLAKPNPIHCIDSDAGENFIQSSYMKPGHYAPPQKPASFQKAVDNTIPIEDIPAVGIPFLYSAPNTGYQHQPKSLECSNSQPQIQMSKEINNIKDSEITWKAALSMAGPFRDNMMAERNDDCPNLKLSETVSLKSHFLLSDGNSQNSSSSSDSLKVISDNDERSDYSNRDLPVAKSNTKTTDWLNGSFNNSSQDNDNWSIFNFQEENHLKNKQAEVRNISEETNKLEINEYKESYFSTNYVPNLYDGLGSIREDINFNKSDDVLNPFFGSETGYLQKKPRKNKKVRDDFSYFDHKNALYFNKPEQMVFTRNMSNKVCGQLEDILNCIWNTKVSTLVDEDIKSDKELAKLEVKVRSPLYLQAMRCKLSNHSYDTLDQALTDFQQYFADIRNKSKGDKLCLAAVSALERMFLGLVEQYFGLSCQSQQSQSGMTPSAKVRRPKKPPRRI